jgi:hypothetical protein
VLDKQKLFDNAAGVIRQGRSSTSSFGCSYVSNDGKAHCALGWSMTKEEQRRYDSSSLTPEWLGEEPNALAKKFGAETEEDVAWLKSLQRCHDNASTEEGLAFVHQFYGAMHLLASQTEKEGLPLTMHLVRGELDKYVANNRT